MMILDTDSDCSNCPRFVYLSLQNEFTSVKVIYTAGTYNSIVLQMEGIALGLVTPEEAFPPQYGSYCKDCIYVVGCQTHILTFPILSDEDDEEVLASKIRLISGIISAQDLHLQEDVQETDAITPYLDRETLSYLLSKRVRSRTPVSARGGD